MSVFEMYRSILETSSLLSTVMCSRNFDSGAKLAVYLLMMPTMSDRNAKSLVDVKVVVRKGGRSRRHSSSLWNTMKFLLCAQWFDLFVPS